MEISNNVAKLLGTSLRGRCVRLGAAVGEIKLELSSVNEGTLLVVVSLLGVGRRGEVDIAEAAGPSGVSVRDYTGAK